MTLPIEAKVREIIDAVKQNGDQALLTFTQKFDGLDVKDIKVGPETLKKAYENAPRNLIDALFHAKANIEAFHKLQLGQESLTWKTDEKTIRLETVPLDRVAIYAPGGRAAYPSSVLMNAIPAQIAGVKEIVLLTPPTQSPETNPVYMAAWLLGITEVYSVGGAQAVAAAAYGTETIRPVDLISGPGNAYVTEAKRQVFGDVAIDMLAGPTELTIIADDSANPSFIAADLLAQAEHDPEAKLTLVDLGMDLDTLKDTLQLYLKENPTTPANRSIQCLEIKNARTVQDATELVNKIAPEQNCNSS
ncbi:histidinol dehydrogenase [Fusibacter tunisiensis]|uniref:histidinol dehydrogenase n=1 Tax=Fusibacter tunisiensis TaxID=1008308 RepID=A0ABS2MQ00_9FIRM|nr:histidinol dehydrogenase [Fusibacter tunisiensis]MBM7561392.1 histidinol dehydrogenase [Fusibacter tunisiensis]